MQDKILMPRALTAENGAKEAFRGEFFLEFRTDCHNCCESDEEICEVCDGTGSLLTIKFIPWTTIKEIYASAIKLLGEEVKN